MTDDQLDVHREVLRLLLQKIDDDPYPSTTMMDMVEGLLRPEEVPAYVAILMDKIQADTFPSINLLNRITAYG
ncbi:hypothetical protein [Nocardioides panacisoli]|uniref:DUF3349 domain-containing protein n=1 Tax=Nocardioides panacisoli TaxID=627624 RepID=A0ABP7J6C3_9ACTN